MITNAIPNEALYDKFDMHAFSYQANEQSYAIEQSSEKCIDDELTPEEWACIERGLEDIKQGRTIPIKDINNIWDSI